MTVEGAACGARYLLPERLMGRAGARVRCPRCGARFVVALPAPPHAGPARAPAGPPAAPDSELDALDARLGGALAEAHARGRLFAEHGPALLDAFDAFRRRAARPDAAAAFRAALARRWGVRLGMDGDV